MAASLSNLKDILNRPPPSPIPTTVAANLDSQVTIQADMREIYKIENRNWYSAKPYGFKMRTRDNNVFTMFIPITPSNISISTPFATNIIPTLYGTVEEHSDVRYFDIVIEGTTGMAPKFVEPGFGDSMSTLYSSLSRRGRTTAEVASSISAGGFFSKTLGLVNQIVNKATDLVNGAPKPKAGLYSENSGYVAFHNLYRFLMRYKKDASGTGGSTSSRPSHPLTFFNYKDNNEYNVVVRSFTMRRSAEDPMLYFYSIQLRGYNLRTIESEITEDLQARLQELGLAGVDSSSVLGDIKSLSSQAKGIIGSAMGGLNVLGR